MPHTFLLFINDPATGYVQTLSFPTAFDRALLMITLSAQPLVLRTADYV